MSSPPQRIGPYLVQRELGRGGMGVVYLALDEKLSREVAIKALGERHIADPQWQERLAHEARLLARLCHPHIALIYEKLDEEDGSSYLVLEYVPGSSLRDKLKAGPLDLAEALDTCGQIARALEAAHNRGIVHRDLKPENVRITPEGVAKVLDFGLAATHVPERVLAGASDSATRETPVVAELDSESHLVVGTPGYMSPEQARGRIIDKRTDIFSFGCVLYECLTGRMAFEGDTLGQRLSAVLFDDPDWSALPLDTPDPIRVLLPRCLNKNIADRLRDLGDARLEIEAALLRTDSGLQPVYAAAPNNLPSEVSSFVGRDEILRRLSARLGETRLMTLTGAGGCGKTRLALQLARRALQTHPDGVWFAELAGLKEPDLVWKAVAAAMAAPGNSADELIEHCRSRAMLVVIDNCEHLITSCRQLTDRLLRACPRLRIIVTSQQVLGVPGEFVFRIPSLTLPGLAGDMDFDEVAGSEAVRLFCERARLADPAFEFTPAIAATVAEVCNRLDGIPLAIELAAARVKMLNVQQIHSRLDDRFRLLTDGDESVLPRHQTLLAAVEWSVSLLSAEESRFLQLLAVFAGGWTLEAATRVCDPAGDELATLTRLTRLVDKSLVMVDGAEAGGKRYRLQETLRQYVRSRLQRSGEMQEAMRRHLEYYLTLFEAAHANDSVATRLQVERENLVGAAQWGAADAPHHSVTLRFRVSELTRWLGVLPPAPSDVSTPEPSAAPVVKRAGPTRGVKIGIAVLVIASIGAAVGTFLTLKGRGEVMAGAPSPGLEVPVEAMATGRDPRPAEWMVAEEADLNQRLSSMVTELRDEGNPAQSPLPQLQERAAAVSALIAELRRRPWDAVEEPGAIDPANPEAEPAPVTRAVTKVEQEEIVQRANQAALEVYELKKALVSVMAESRERLAAFIQAEVDRNRRGEVVEGEVLRQVYARGLRTIDPSDDRLTWAVARAKVRDLGAWVRQIELEFSPLPPVQLPEGSGLDPAAIAAVFDSQRDAAIEQAGEPVLERRTIPAPDDAADAARRGQIKQQLDAWATAAGRALADAGEIDRLLSLGYGFTESPEPSHTSIAVLQANIEGSRSYTDTRRLIEGILVRADALARVQELAGKVALVNAIIAAHGDGSPGQAAVVAAAWRRLGVSEFPGDAPELARAATLLVDIVLPALERVPDSSRRTMLVAEAQHALRAMWLGFVHTRTGGDRAAVGAAFDAMESYGIREADLVALEPWARYNHELWTLHKQVAALKPAMDAHEVAAQSQALRDLLSAFDQKVEALDLAARPSVAALQRELAPFREDKSPIQSNDGPLAVDPLSPAERLVRLLTTTPYLTRTNN